METFLYMLPIAIVFIGFYFIVVRPLQKKYGPKEVEVQSYYWDDVRNTTNNDGTPRMGAGFKQEK